MDLIRKFLNNQPQANAWSELEINVYKVQGLLQMLVDKIDHIRMDGSEFSGQTADRFCAGAGQLVLEAQNNLRAAFDKTFHAVKSPVVAPSPAN